MDAEGLGRAARCSVACVMVASIFNACSSGASDSSGGPEPTAATSSSTPAPTPADDGTPSGERDLDVDELVVPAAAEAMPATWQERFVIGYGRGKALLGTSPGGDSGSLDIGPEYGAPGPDGTWWFLDAAKARLAHYDSAGQFLDHVRITEACWSAGATSSGSSRTSWPTASSSPPARRPTARRCSGCATGSPTRSSSRDVRAAYDDGAAALRVRGPREVE